MKESPDTQEDIHSDPNIFLKSERESEDNLVKVELQKLVIMSSFDSLLMDFHSACYRIKC